MNRTWTLGLYAAFFYLFIYAPIAVVVLYSFNAATFGAGWHGFSAQWYPRLFHNPAALSAAQNTLVLALSSTTISTLLGTLLGFGMERYVFPGKRLVARLLQIPVFIPDVVLGAGLLLFYSVARRWLQFLELGLLTMVLAQVTFQISFVAIVVRSRLADFDPSLEEAARDLGASPFQTFLHVTLPLMRPGIITGAMLAFTLSLDDFVVSFFTSGPGSTTLPILIYSSVKRGITPEINALSTIIIAVSILSAASVGLLRRLKTEP